VSGRGVHVMTANDYLAERDAEWMGPPYRRSWPATFAALTAGLEHGEHYEIAAEHQTASLTASGARVVEDRLGLDNLYAEAHLSLVRYLETALAVKECYQKGRDYSVSDGQAFDPTARQSVPVPMALRSGPWRDKPGPAGRTPCGDLQSPWLRHCSRRRLQQGARKPPRAAAGRG
jgi:hypothetical protein